ncbi:MAG: hypothetical protein AAGF25_01695 [Pseudomonadota bacterium]
MLSRKIKLFARRHWLPLVGFIASLGLAVFFAVTFMADAIYFNDPRHKDVDLQGWMTPRYVVLSYDVPRGVILDALGLTTEANGQGLRMRDIAQQQEVGLAELTERVREAAGAHREANQ